MFIEYINTINETVTATQFLREKGFKIKNEIPRKQGIELVFYSVEDAFMARKMLQNVKTSIRDNCLFIFY